MKKKEDYLNNYLCDHSRSQIIEKCKFELSYIDQYSLVTALLELM